MHRTHIPQESAGAGATSAVTGDGRYVVDVDLADDGAAGAIASVTLGEQPDGLWDHPVQPDDRRWMAEALAMAEHALTAGELPIGAVVVAGDRVVGRAFTQERTQGRLLVHAELLALDQADRTHAVTRVGTVLYSTLEPCLMCLGAAATTMVDRIVFALASPGDGATEAAREWDRGRRAEDLPHVRLPSIVGGVGEDASRALFRRFRDQRADSADPLAAWASALVDADG